MINRKLISWLVFLVAVMPAYAAPTSLTGFYTNVPAYSYLTYKSNQLSYVLTPPTFNIWYAVDPAEGASTVKVSVWVHKTTWNADGTFNPSQSDADFGKRYNPSNGYYEPTMQSLRECSVLTANDMDKLMKVHEFPVHAISEAKTGITETWDGFTDPALTGGVKYPVRDCIYLTIDDAATGKIVQLQSQGLWQFSRYYMTQGVNYTTDGKNNYSANIDVPMPTNLPPVTHVYALLMSNECNISTLTFSAVNKGTPYMVKYMNDKSPGNQQVLAYTELTNPVIDKDNPIIHSYTWKDMKWIKMDGTQTTDPIYPTSDFPYFIMTIILETNDKTVTGINDGVINNGPYIDMRNAKVLTGIPTITPQTSDIKITPVLGGFNIDCPDGICMTGYSVTDMTGRTLRSGTLSNSTMQHIEVPPAPKGLITIIKAWGKDLDNNGMERFNTTKTISR